MPPTADSYLDDWNALAKQLQELPFDPNGHFTGIDLSQRPFVRNAVRERFQFGCLPCEVSEEDVRALLDGTNPPGRWIHVSIPMSDRLCPHCDRSYLDLETDGTVLRVRGACSRPGIRPPIKWTLSLPSGKMVVANDLRELFPLPREESLSGTLRDFEADTLLYAKVGMAHAKVGNTDPKVYRRGPLRYEIANYGWDEETGERRIPPDAEEVARISTDLWWYSICDYDEYRRRAAQPPEGWGEPPIHVVDVAPGLYEFTHQSWEGDGPSTTVYTTIEWVGPPDGGKE